MKKLLVLLVFISSFSFSQEYDDMYYSKKDRKTVVVKTSHSKHVNPEYVARYTSTPKVKVHIQSYHVPYYNTWSLGYDYWYPYGYDYYGYHPYSYPYGYNSWNWYYGASYFVHYPYYGYYNDVYFMHYTNYSWNSYYRYSTNEIKYQPRTESRSSVYIPRSSTTSRSTRTTVNDDRNIRIPNNSAYDRNSNSRISTYTQPRGTTQTRSYNNSSNTSPSRSIYTPSRSSQSYSPSRSSSSSRSFVPSRGSGSNSYTPSRGSGSSGRSGGRQ